MTDNEIIKALECCSNRFCHCCPLFADDGCVTLMAREALALINRQKAEIEEMEAEIDKQYEQAKADILGNMADGGTSCHWCIEQHKAEAIKEFAERLKEKSQPYEVTTAYAEGEEIKAIELSDIDNLVKEMAGEGK